MLKINEYKSLVLGETQIPKSECNCENKINCKCNINSSHPNNNKKFKLLNIILIIFH